ncbi:Swt1 family HEPN domain-containing protein [Psychroserpens sp. Hel_I_66]|uniref:Swt1 family HEPN domain-containing protein n=1 Tax=Psychroserpens sp. Hel_I_66 TaxID=1250004 RepID=UPI00068ECFC9|nr:Swt1 family HEPN domain-containing protein [Psychroserpens sp. Hel_I_66]
MKIGALVKAYIPKILEYCKNVDHKELEKLMDKEYSNKTFGINFPFCSDVIITLLDSKRYWKDKYILNSKAIRVSSQWNINHKTKFLNYLLLHNLISEIEYKELDLSVEHSHSKSQSLEISKLEIYNKEIFTGSLNSYFEESLVSQANFMSIQYQKFYCLERSIRELVKEVMINSYNDNWWNKVDFKVRDNVKNNLEYELDTSHTKRSEHKIDYSTFGDLRKIINSQWEIFKPKFNRSLKSVNEVMIDLNRLRVPIAHCTPLADKEIKRLDIRIDDWYDLLDI